MQESWQSLQQQGSALGPSGSGSQGTLLLRVIANSAARFPAAEAAQLAADLLKVSIVCQVRPDPEDFHIARPLVRMTNPLSLLMTLGIATGALFQASSPYVSRDLSRLQVGLLTYWAASALAVVPVLSKALPLVLVA